MIFPGQATEIVDPRPFLEKYPGAISILDFGEDFFPGLYQKSPEELIMTLNQQPGVALHSLAVANALNTEGFEMPEFVAGHSLGAIISLIYARVLPDAIGMKTLAVRAQITQKWADKNPGKMVAVVGLPYEVVNSACQGYARQGRIVVAANYNEPEQIVISGEERAVDEVYAYLEREWNPKKIIPLPTQVAFHSPLLKEASEEFDIFLSLQNFSDPVRGMKVVIDDLVLRSGQEIKVYLPGHMLRPVMWVPSLRLMMEKYGLRHFLIVGPGQKMVKMIKRTAGFFNYEVNVICLATGEDIKTFLENPFA